MTDQAMDGGGVSERGNDWKRRLSFLLCFVVTFGHILHFLIKMIFCCWFGQKNDLVFSFFEIVSIRIDQHECTTSLVHVIDNAMYVYQSNQWM